MIASAAKTQKTPSRTPYFNLTESAILAMAMDALHTLAGRSPEARRAYAKVCLACLPVTEAEADRLTVA